MHSVAAFWEYAHIAAAGYNSIYVVEYDYTLSANAELQGSLEKKPVVSNLQENESIAEHFEQKTACTFAIVSIYV